MLHEGQEIYAGEKSRMKRRFRSNSCFSIIAVFLALIALLTLSVNKFLDIGTRIRTQYSFEPNGNSFDKVIYYPEREILPVMAAGRIKHFDKRNSDLIKNLGHPDPTTVKEYQ
mmetsp:Transcript_14439/g.22387  ORF Transcript_14439/g.22387 Transcript_14439/m.22387 type:complete len:113 (+) Transcript_14439:251-589(+)